MKDVRTKVAEVEDLRAALKRYGISAIDAAKIIGAGAKSVYNWLNATHAPTTIWREKIRAGLRKMDRYYAPSLAEESRRVFKTVWPHLTRTEKDELFEMVASSGFSDQAYLAELVRLGGIHGVKAPGKSAARLAPRKR